MTAVGDTVWIFLMDRRVYPKAEPGRLSSGGPIYREHFVERTIASDTGRSWVLSDRLKINKRTLLSPKDHRGYAVPMFTSPQQVEDLCYVHDERARLASQVQQCSDAATLRAIDALLTVGCEHA